MFSTPGSRANRSRSYAGTFNKVGVGTARPAGQFEISISGDSHNSAWHGAGLNIVGALDNSCNTYCSAIGSSAQTLVEWLWYRTRGNHFAPTALQDGDTIGQFQVGGRDGAGSIAATFGLGTNHVAVAVGNWTASNHGCKLVWATTPQGSTFPVTAFTIQASGGISIGAAADPGVKSIGIPAGGKVDFNGTGITFTESSFAMVVGSFGGAALTTVKESGGDITSMFQIQDAGSAASLQMLRWSNTATGCPRFILGKSRASVGGRTVVQSGDLIGKLLFVADDGTNIISAAFIQGAVDGTPGTNDMPGRLDFFTTPDGSGNPAQRLRITNKGSVVVGDNSAALATSATDGFLYIPTCAGTPSGTPTTQTGTVPMIYDTTNNKMYVFNGGAWKGGTAPGAWT